VLLFVITVTYLSNNFHHRVAKGAEGIYFLFAAERPANKKAQALQANIKSERRIAEFYVSMNGTFSL